MYSIDQYSFGPYTIYRVEHPVTKNGFSVVPEIGGTLIDLWFNGQSVLDGYATPEELTEAKWGKSAILFPFPNRLLDGQYTWDGKTYQFPINNAATGNAIHGFSRHLPFQIADTQMDADSGSCTIVQDYDGHLAYYPFPCRLSVRFSINNNNELATTVTVENLHTSAIPFGFGWHPYFRLTEAVGDTVLTLPACDKIDIDARMIPTGAREPYAAFDSAARLGDTVLDNCFYFEKDIVAVLEGSGRRFSMEVPAAQFPYFQVFTPPQRASVAFEPMTCNVDALNNGDGLEVLAAGAHWAGTFVCKLEEAPVTA